MVFNASDVGQSGVIALSYAQLAANFGALLFGFGGIFMTAAAGKRKRRHEHFPGDQQFNEEVMLQQVILKVLDEVDYAGCTALALCESVSIKPEERTPAQSALVSILSSQPSDVPLSWTNLQNPVAKYQYASFIGHWSRSVHGHSHCSQVFPKCPLPPSEVFQIMTSRELPCPNPLQSLSALRN